MSWLFYIGCIPDNWYGGSGTVGNRYFLNLLPLALYIVPSGMVRLTTAAAGAHRRPSSSCRCSRIRCAAPSARAGGRRTACWRRLPAELAMLNDLSIFAEPWRKKVPFGNTEGDVRRHAPADATAYYLYFSDDGTFFKERAFERDGFWLKGGERAEIILRALEPVTAIHARVTAGPAGDTVSLGSAAASAKTELRPNAAGELRIAPGAPFVYKDSFVYVLKAVSARGAGTANDARSLGTFISIELETAPRR